MAVTEPPPTYTPLAELDEFGNLIRFSPIWLRWFTDLSSRTGGEGSTNVSTDTAFQIAVTANYTVTGDFDLEIVDCNNTVGTTITITMPTHVRGDEVIVTRGGLGSVKVNGGSTDIIGARTHFLPFQHDSAHMYGKASEWGLR